MPDNTTVLPDKGTPQGGIISPLLANIVLNELDWWIASQWEENPIAISRGRERIIGKTKVFDKSHGYRIMKNTEMKEMHIIRYADDFRIFCKTRGDAQKLFYATKDWLHHRLGLEINEQKSQIVNLKKRYSEFLGFKMKLNRRGKKKNGEPKYIVQSHITEKSAEKIALKARELIYNIQNPADKSGQFAATYVYNSFVIGVSQLL